MGTPAGVNAAPLHMWIVNQYALPPDQAGITRNYALAEHMISEGIRSLIIAAQTNYLSRAPGGFNAGQRLDLTRPIPFLWIPAPSYKGNGLRRILNMLIFAVLAVILPMINLRRGRIDNPDVILGSSPTLFSGVSAWALARILDARFVLEIRDLHPLSITALTNTSPRHPYVRLLKLIERMLYRRADLIVSPLQGAGDYVRDTIGEDRPWIWIPNSVDVDLIPNPGPVRSDPKPFNFVYAGAHGLANDLQIVVQAAKMLTDENIHFTFYGDGVAKADLLKVAKRHKLENVEFRDPIPKTAIYEQLVEADALVFILADNALWEHGLSANKLYDYLACARPILMATNSSHNPVAAATAGVTVAPGSATAFAAGARLLAHLPAHDRESMGRRGRLLVQQDYHLPSLALALAHRLRALS